MKKRVKKIGIPVIFLLGLAILLYPLVANQWNDYRQKRLLSSYETSVAEKEAAGEIDYEAEWEKAKAYNEALKPSILPDSFAIAEADKKRDETYMEALNLTGDGTMGVVEIPKIDVKLPIFHTSSKEVLEKAAGHLEGSSLPTGGEGNHTVITAHRGLPSATLFTDLDQLKKGDHFLLHILDKTLCYEVDQILVVEPEETEALSITEGKDLATLVTCTPYGVNTHRMLVRGHRVEYSEKVLENEDKVGPSLHTNYLLWVIVGLVVTAVFIGLLYMREKKRMKKGEQKSESIQTEVKSEADKPEEDV